MSGMAVEDPLALWSAELRGAKACIRPLFQQPNSVSSAATFLDGLLGPERRKTEWMCAEAAGDPGPWRQQAMLGRSHWDADTLRDLVRDHALETLAEPDATLVIDDVTGAAQFNSWGRRPAVADTADVIADGLAPAAWRRQSAGDRTKGPRLFDWAYLELADLDPQGMGGPPGLRSWTRGLLIRRRIGNGERAFFTTWCRTGTPIETLVRVEGHCWAIEDAFETAKTELGLDHTETRSWHRPPRVRGGRLLVMLAFALLAIVRHEADAYTAPPKTRSQVRYRLSGGRCRRSVALPAA